MTHEEFLAEQQDIMNNYNAGFLTGAELHHQLIDLSARVIQTASYEYLHNN